VFLTSFRHLLRETGFCSDKSTREQCQETSLSFHSVARHLSILEYKKNQYGCSSHSCVEGWWRPMLWKQHPVCKSDDWKVNLKHGPTSGRRSVILQPPPRLVWTGCSRMMASHTPNTIATNQATFLWYTPPTHKAHVTLPSSCPVSPHGIILKYWKTTGFTVLMRSQFTRDQHFLNEKIPLPCFIQTPCFPQHSHGKTFSH
jgi:hypothetical protein